MVDYSVSSAPQQALLSAKAHPFKMEELALVALLECPLCRKQLDVSAKVLPCQHTFCLPCLKKRQEEEAVAAAAHSQPLLCPECRTSVPVRTVEELPTNLLLVRLLEGLRGSPRLVRDRKTAHYAMPLSRGAPGVRHGQQQQQQQQQLERPQKEKSELAVRTSTHNQQADLSGEPVPMSGHGVNPKHKVDEDRHRRSSSESSGTFAGASTLHTVNQMSEIESQHQSQPPAALCRALCEFKPEELNLEDSHCCLGFIKGDILTVIRRVDENWIEAKLGEKVGVCPLQFTEPNSVAAKLLEGKNRKTSDSAEFYQRTGNVGKDKAADAAAAAAAGRTSLYGAPLVSAKAPIINALPATNQRKQPTANNSSFYQASREDAGNVGNFAIAGRQAPPRRLSAPPATGSHSHPSRVNSQRIRRQSGSSHRHLSQSEKKMTNETPPTIAMALVNPQMPSISAEGKSSSTQQLSISVCAVLYSYKPRRPEELELRKGEMVGVYGKFKEGWLRGLSLRTGKVGILPSNYISPVLRTSARLLETKAANTSSQYNTATGKNSTAAKNPAVVLALDRVNSDGAMYSTGQVPSVPNGAQHCMSSTVGGKPSLYAGTQGWETVRRIFNPHRGSHRMSNVNIPSHSRHFAQVQATGYSPALLRKKNSSAASNPGRILGWMTEPAAPSAAHPHKDRDFTASHEAAFQHDRQSSNGPQSILVRPDSHKNNIDKPAKSVRFLTDDNSPPTRPRTTSWSSGSQVHPNSHRGPPPLEVWAPSLTMGRDGPGIVLKEGKVSVPWKGHDTTTLDLTSSPRGQILLQPSMSAVSAQFSPSRHRVSTTHLAQTDSEISLLQGELVLVHRPRPDGRLLITQESSGQTGLFHCSVLQGLERLS